MVDAQIHVLQRALNDYAQGTAIHVTGSREIDFSTYMKEYWACIGFSEFVARLKDFAPERNLIVTPDQVEDTVVIFGGP